MKLLIAVPCMDMVHALFASSLCNLLLSKQDEEIHVEFGVASLIYDTRNQLLEKAISGGFDRILWLDSDMEFEPEILRILSNDLDNGFDIVSGLYFKRVQPHQPTIFKKCDIERLEGNKLNPVNEFYLDYPQNSIFEIAACGFGCVMMNVAAVASVIDAYGRFLFAPVGGFGEDLSFCMRARAAGLQIWCDSRVKLGHVGYHVVNEQTYQETSDGNKR